MGWSSGDRVFDPVADTLIRHQADWQLTEDVCTALIGSLRDRGWDTEGESLGAYRDHPAIRAAFARHGIFLECHAEHKTEPWMCEEREEHGGKHRDYQGNEW
ncbi:hypothetical protein [Rhodococcus qingshengii]|uniref:hypothetical protein n=1 Tax=Rhodococcus qingshengii TaxID=334542 RepID=UPI0035D77D9A